MLPTSDGGDPITGYKIEHSPNGDIANGPTRLPTPATLTQPIHTPASTPRRPDTTASSPSTRSASVTPQTSQTPPPPSRTARPKSRALRSCQRNGALSIRWTAVSDVTGYKVAVEIRRPGLRHKPSKPRSRPELRTNYVISGLNNGTQYTVRLIATKTGADDGPPSAGEDRHTIRHLTDGHLRTRLLHRLGERRHRDSNGGTERAGGRRRHDPAQGSTPRRGDHRGLFRSTRGD